VPIPGGSVKLYLDDSGINRDSGILVRSDGQTFLNLNDCKLNEELPLISATEGPISVFTCQFSGATWHPTCYEYEPQEYQRISKKKLYNKFEMVARAIETTRPRTYLPSAGPACFLDPALIELNFGPVTIFPRAPQLIQYLRKRLARCETRVLEIMPGDAVGAVAGEVVAQGKERVDDSEFETYIRSYAARYNDYFRERQRKPSEEQAQELLSRLILALKRKLDAFELHDRLSVPLYFGLSDFTGKMLKIDFPSRTVKHVAGIPESDYYSLMTPSWQIARVLDGAIT
jgi:UDP-MurNAc hydroxylase